MPPGFAPDEPQSANSKLDIVGIASVDYLLRRRVRGDHEWCHFPLGTDTLNFRFNVSCLTRMRPPVNYHQKHGRTSWRYGCSTFRSVRNDPVMLSLYCSRPGKEAPTLCKKGLLKSTNVLMELAMINWPEMLSQAEEWAARFWVGTATASLVGIIVAAAALLTHAI